MLPRSTAGLRPGGLLSSQILPAMAGKVWDESAPPARKTAVDHGNVFYTIPGTELDGWIKASAGLYDEWAADMDKRGLPGKQMLQDARGLIAKYQK